MGTRRLCFVVSLVVLGMLPWLPAAQARSMGTLTVRKVAGARLLGGITTPLVYAWDGFNHANGLLNNVVSGVTGLLWSQGSGSWQTVSNTARSGTIFTGVLNLDCAGHVDGTTYVSMSNLGSLGGIVISDNEAGLVFNSNGSRYWRAVYREQTVLLLFVTATFEIKLYNGLSSSVRASTTVSRRSTASLKVVQNAGAISLYVDGSSTPTLTATMSAAELSTSTGYRQPSYSKFGLYAAGADGVGFDDVRCESL